MRPVIAILTDFGLRDHYVASMKGVVLSICPDATLVDITHEVPPQDVPAGALELHACYRHFPPDTIFLAVVDPGVGSARRPMAARAGHHYFVAPDNGLLAPIFDESPPDLLVQLDEPRFAAPTVSRTFEGRDRFAPAAAWLARGVELSALGPRLESYQPLPLPAPVVHDEEVRGQVVRIDHFGNLVTNITAGDVERVAGRDSHPGGSRIGVPAGQSWRAARCTVGLAGRDEAIRLVATYSGVDEGKACALIGSTGHVEISVNKGSAAARFGASRGDPVILRRTS